MLLHGYRAMQLHDHMANPNPNPLHRRLCSLGHCYRGIASKWPGILQLISQKKDYAFLVNQEQKYGPLGSVRAQP